MDLDTLLDALEVGALLLPDLPGRVEPVRLPGVRGRVTWDSDPFANLVGAASLGEEGADAAIAEILDFFGREGKTFGWLVGPRSTPWDLAARLERAGLYRASEFAGMVRDPHDPIWANPAVYVWEAGAEDFETAGWLMSEGMGVAREQTRAVTEALFFGEGPIWRRIYLAGVEDADHPVGFASMAYMPDQPIVHLSSAATLEGYRGRGVYTALMARRLADAAADGAEAATIHANRATSAPICARLGFIEVATLALYAWYAWPP